MTDITLTKPKAVVSLEADEELVRRGHLDPVEVDERVGKQRGVRGDERARDAARTHRCFGRPLGERVPEERGGRAGDARRREERQEALAAERRAQDRPKVQQLQRVMEQVERVEVADVGREHRVDATLLHRAQRARGVPPHEARRDLPEHERDEAQRKE